MLCGRGVPSYYYDEKKICLRGTGKIILQGKLKKGEETTEKGGGALRRESSEFLLNHSSSEGGLDRSFCRGEVARKRNGRALSSGKDSQYSEKERPLPI